MPQRRPIRPTLSILFFVAIATILTAMSLGIGPLRVKHMRTADSQGGGSSLDTMALEGDPPFVTHLNLAIDVGELDRDFVVKALQEPLEAWFGSGNVRVVPMPQPGEIVTEPLLAVRVIGEGGFWSPVFARADLHIVSVGVDPPESGWPWTATVLDRDRHQNPLRNDPSSNFMDVELDIGIRTSGFVPLRDYREELADRVARPIVEHLVAYAQKEASAPNVPSPPPSELLTIDWSRPFTVRCDGQEMPFTVTFRKGEWGRHYELSYVQDQRCVWEFTAQNISRWDLESGEWTDPGLDLPYLYTFTAAECTTAGENDWRPCAGRTLPPGGRVTVRTAMQFDVCERYHAGGGMTVGLIQNVASSTGLGEASAILPWKTSLFVENPPDSACPARFPVPATRVAVASWLNQTLGRELANDERITAGDLTFKDDVFDNSSTINPDRLASFSAEIPDHTCVGLVRFRREPEDWISVAKTPGQALFTETLVSHGVRCVPNAQVAVDKGVAFRVAVRDNDGEDYSVAVGISTDSRAEQARTATTTRDQLTEIRDGTFAVVVRDAHVAAAPTWPIDLKPAPHYAEPVGRLTVPLGAMVPAANRDGP
jgi:hypothetical protein